MRLYARPGQRRVLPPIVFGAGVLWHLARHGRRYDVVHTCSFPYFSLLAIAVLAPVHAYSVVVDWFEVWSRSYWRSYLGRRAGDAGWMVQRLCARVPQHAFCFSRLYARRLREEGLRGEVTMLGGAYDGSLEPHPVYDNEPVVVFAGRHIPEKRVAAIVPAIARVRVHRPDVRGLILGDGPERDEVVRLVRTSGLSDAIDLPGFVPTDVVDRAISHALCLLLPSRREGYGLVVVEAAARGTPSVVVAGEDNAAVELIEEGINGFVAASDSPEDLARAIAAVDAGGTALRRSTQAWFAANARRVSLARSQELVVEVYDSRGVR
jgi:glycosyltransferase involved in cell wall biosynthesis